MEAAPGQHAAVRIAATAEGGNQEAGKEHEVGGGVLVVSSVVVLKTDFSANP